MRASKIGLNRHRVCYGRGAAGAARFARIDRNEVDQVAAARRYAGVRGALFVQKMALDPKAQKATSL